MIVFLHHSFRIELVSAFPAQSILWRRCNFLKVCADFPSFGSIYFILHVQTALIVSEIIVGAPKETGITISIHLYCYCS